MLTRVFTRGLALLLLMALVLPLAALVPTQPAEAKSKTLTFSNTGAITIPGSGLEGNADPFPSTIQASGFKKGKIQHVTVALINFSHTQPDDVGILVQAPNGETAILMANAGGNIDVADLTITFDDASTTLLPDGGTLTSGTFHPTVYDFPSDSTAPYVPLTGFNGGNPNGVWQLFVFDDFPGQNGSIAGGWSITIQATIKKKKK